MLYVIYIYIYRYIYMRVYRHGLLAKWLELAATVPSVASSLYEERSFMRDMQLRHFLVQMLDTLSSMTSRRSLSHR